MNTVEYRWEPEGKWAQENVLPGYYWQTRPLRADAKQFEIRYNKIRPFEIRKNKISPCPLESGTGIFDGPRHIQQTDGRRYELKIGSRDGNLILTSEGSSQSLCQ